MIPLNRAERPGSTRALPTTVFLYSNPKSSQNLRPCSDPQFSITEFWDTVQSSRKCKDFVVKLPMCKPQLHQLLFVWVSCPTALDLCILSFKMRLIQTYISRRRDKGLNTQQVSGLQIVRYQTFNKCWYVFFLIGFVLFHWDRVSVCSSDWHGTVYVDQDGLEVATFRWCTWI